MQHFFYLRRVENKAYEEIQEGKLQKIQENIKVYKENAQKLSNNISGLYKEIDDLRVDIDLLKNYNKYTGFDEKLTKSVMRKNLIDRSDDFERKVKLQKVLDVISFVNII